MLVFIILAILALAGLLLRQTTLRFQASTAADWPGGRAAGFKIGAFIKWLIGRSKALAPGLPRKTWAVFNGWAVDHYPGILKWGFLAFAAAFLYLGASGFFFAVFIRRGMFGLPLLAHVMSGGLFAVGLAAVLLWRARDYRLDQAEAAVFEAFACPIMKNVSKAFVRKVLFWAFAALGFIQVTTALGSMLPVFTFETQLALIMIHRYSALGLVLTAGLFFDITLLDRTRAPRA